VLSTVTNASCGNGFNAARAWQAVDACGNAATCTQTVAVVDHGAPAIVTQPQSETVPVGQTATFTIGASGCPPPSYQWYFNGTSIVAGATAAALVLNNVTANQAGNYQVVVSNPYGTVTSAPAQLTIVSALTIVSGPTDQLVDSGGTASFSVTAQGAGPLSYQWYFNQTQALPGATSPTLTLNNVTLSQAGSYQVVVSNPYGGVTSAPARLTVVLPAQILSGPTDQVGTNGGNVAFTVSAQGTPPLTYQWYFNGTNSLAQGTGATLTLNNITPSQAGNYEVVVSNPYGSATSSAARLTIAVPAAIVTGPASQIATNGDNVTFTVVAQGTPPLSYQWYFNLVQPLAGATSSALTLNPVAASQAGVYTVVVSNPYGSVTSAPAQLTVQVRAAIISGPTSQVVESGATVVFAVTAQGTAPLTYQWFFNSTNRLSGATNTSLTLTGVTTQNSGNYSVAVSNAFGSGLSQPASLRVLVPAELIALTLSQNVAALTFSTVPNLLYSVYYNDDLGTTNWTALPKATLLQGTGAPLTVQDARANVSYRFYEILVQ